jgi:RNA methyltransferase, TrmH family
MRLLSVARDLRRRKARERAELFVVEGIRAVEELVTSPIAIRGVLVAPHLAASPRGIALRSQLETRGVTVLEVSDRELASAAETDTPQGVLAIGVVPKRDLDAVRPAGGTLRLLVLDGVQDPGNVGTIVRTAAALGVHATVALPGTVDLWNAKVVRSAMGALFHHAAFATTWDAFDSFRDSHRIAVWGADAGGEPVAGRSARLPKRLALVVGNEGHGLTEPARARLDAAVSVPMMGVESLNVAVVAGVLLYALQPSGPAPGPSA